MSLLSWLLALVRPDRPNDPSAFSVTNAFAGGPVTDAGTAGPDLAARESEQISNVLVPRSFRYLKATSVLGLARFERPVEPPPGSLDPFYPTEHPPAVVLFISHRWDTRNHPDPDGRQLQVIQSLLRSIAEVAACSELPGTERVRRIPSLRVHGLFQAALVIGAHDASDDEDNVWRHWAPVLDRHRGKALEHVGIWYDYACMAPMNASTVGDDTARASLSHLPDLVRSCPLVILRTPGDAYDERGWCAAEVAAARRDRSIIVVRMDLLGTPLHDSDLILSEGDDEGGSATSEFLFVRHALDEWESESARAPHLRGLFIGLPGMKPAEESRPLPLVTTGRNPNAFPQQQALLTRFMLLVREASSVDSGGGSLDPPLDLAAAVEAGMNEVGLRCTEDRDIVFVGLSILRSRHHPKLVPTVERFYREAIERWLRGDSIRLVRLRQNRPELWKWDLWYLFEGEDPRVRPKPGWVS